MSNEITTTQNENACAVATTPVSRSLPTTLPATDLHEFEDRVELRLDLPGVARDQVDLMVDDGELTIRADRRLGCAETGDTSWLHQEFGETTYQRKFTIPRDYDPSRIEATMEHGVLTVTLHKAEAARARRIEVR